MKALLTSIVRGLLPTEMTFWHQWWQVYHLSRTIFPLTFITFIFLIQEEKYQVSIAVKNIIHMLMLECKLIFFSEN